MLALHSTATSSRDQGDLYKVLVLDRFCKDIIAPLLRVNELRSQGVTLHLLLEAERQPIPDVPAVYFVQPSAANVDRIAQDAQQALYEAMHINFSTSAPSRLLEQLATGIVKANAVDKVAKIYDEYLAFIALEPGMFSLGLPDCYLSLNDPSAKEMQIEVSHMSNRSIKGYLGVEVSLPAAPAARAAGGTEGVWSLLTLAIKMLDKSITCAASHRPQSSCWRVCIQLCDLGPCLSSANQVPNTGS